MEFSPSLYGLVRAFLKDFYAESKRGTLQHKKGIAIFLSFVLLSFIVIVAGLFKVSETPFFCGLCHNMKIYVESWKASSHRNVDCIKCHYKPGFVEPPEGEVAGRPVIPRLLHHGQEPYETPCGDR